MSASASATRVLEAQATLRRLVARHGARVFGTLWPDFSPEKRQTAVRIIDAQLMLGEPIYIATDPCELIELGATSMPPWKLRPEDLIARVGFAWMAKRIDIGQQTALRALSWHVGRGPEDLPGGPGLIGARIFFWCDIDAMPDLAIPMGSHFWEFGETHLDAFTVARRTDEHRRNPMALAIFASLQAFARQRVVVRERGAADRATRRRGTIAGIVHSECTVITLRPGKPPTSVDRTDEAAIAEWSCRWWVGGHWRQQAYGSERADRRPVWIAPYIKGPDDKPIRTRIYRVVR